MYAIRSYYDYIVDTSKGGQDSCPVHFVVDRPAGPLQAFHRCVGVQADHQAVRRASGLLQIAHMAGMEDVETAVGEGDAAAVAAYMPKLGQQLIDTDNFLGIRTSYNFV